jgi:GTPase Era involved in 16S rRNA processing/uncharacterized tellurite resistance protein B-like protein
MENMNEVKVEILEDTIYQAALVLEENGRSNQNTSVFSKNTVTYLQSMSENLIRFKSLMKGERKPTIGVFGCPSRGKSTLLNVMLGVDVLPMKGKPGTTIFGTELSYKDSEDFSITVRYNNKPPKTFTHSTEIDVRDRLNDLSNEEDPANCDITKIEIEGPFNSFLGNNIAFVDTPGVEVESLTEKKTSEETTIFEHDFASDTKRALSILSSVDIVIFCMILKYKEKKDAEFYNREIKDKYQTINVVTAGDKRDEGETDESIKRKLRSDYKLVRENTVIVSSKEALEKIKKAGAEGKNVSELVEEEFTGENLEGFKELKKMINKLTVLTDENIKTRIENFEELYKRLKKDAAEKNIRLPELISSFSGINDKFPFKVQSLINRISADGKLDEKEIKELKEICEKLHINFDKAEKTAEAAANSVAEGIMRDFIESITRDGKLILNHDKKKALREKAVEYGFNKRMTIKTAKKAIKEKAKGIHLFLWYLLKLLKIIGIAGLIILISLIIIIIING